MKEDDKNDGKTNTSNNTNTNRVSRDKTKKSKDAKKQMDVSDNVAGVPKDLVGLKLKNNFMIIIGVTNLIRDWREQAIILNLVNKDERLKKQRNFYNKYIRR